MILILSDIITITAAFFLTLLLRFGGVIGVVKHQWSTLIFLYVITIGLFYFLDFYNRKMYARRLQLAFRLIRAWVAIVFIYLIVGLLTRFSFLIDSRIFIVVYELFFLLLLLGFRIFLVPKWFDIYYSKSDRKIPCIYLGPKERFKRVRDFLQNNPFLGIGPILVNGDYSNLQDDYSDLNYDYGDKEVFLWSDVSDFEMLYKQIKQLVKMGRNLQVASKLFDELNLNCDWYRIDSVPVYTFRQKNWSSLRPFFKRVIDIVGSFLALVILSPVYGLFALAVKLDSPGSVFFKQRRCGLKGKVFAFYKFRSMFQQQTEDRERVEEFKNYINNREDKGKIVDSENITRVGRILRKTTMDELPQFWNVLKGEMSLVGPRPGIDYEVKHYKNWHRDRLMVKPGMSGLWAVYGRGNMPFDTSVFLDIMYITNRSTSMDIKLIFQIIPVVVFGRGAY